MAAMPLPDRPCPRCGVPLGAGARFCPSCGFALSRLTPGEVLDGKYEILDKIGEGGMGEVYRARHLYLDEIRIIKVTKPDTVGDGAQARRFQEEARLATLVRHPNVAALYDFSRQPDGSYYMVWEFIAGVSLEQWLRRHGKLTPAQTLDIARQALAGLSEIHAQGIVHRDVSPDNIMLHEFPGGRLQAKIIDLGIAKRVAADALRMTGTGLFLGKLKYCSPEQAGSLPPEEGLDARTDIYSFGVVLYEMLSGKPPFESATPEGFIGKHLHAPAPPLDVSTLPRHVGPRLAAVVAQALEKKRERRFASARDLADALALIAPELQQAPPPPVRAGARARTQTLALVALAVLAVAAGAALVARRAGSAKPRTGVRSLRTSPAPATPAGLAAATPGPKVLQDTVPAGSLMPAAPFAQIPAPPAPEPSAGAAPSSLTPPEALRRINLWKARADEPRARRAQEIAGMANRVAAAYPADPRTAEITASLPGFLKSQATGALDRAEPLHAVLYFRAYRLLDFAPADPELERRIDKVRPADLPADRRAPTPDGR
jgi:tRNA A-37 threonylcarbamoyl transferase component Bud32